MERPLSRLRASPVARGDVDAREADDGRALAAAMSEAAALRRELVEVAAGGARGEFKIEKCIEKIAVA